MGLEEFLMFLKQKGIPPEGLLQMLMQQRQGPAVPMSSGGVPMGYGANLGVRSNPQMPGVNGSMQPSPAMPNFNPRGPMQLGGQRS